MLAVVASCQFDQGGLPNPDDEADAGAPDVDPAVGDPAMDPGGPAPEDPCAGGACECPPPMTDCDGSCVDLASDDRNCGECDHRCKRGESCSDGECRRDRGD